MRGTSVVARALLALSSVGALALLLGAACSAFTETPESASDASTADAAPPGVTDASVMDVATDSADADAAVLPDAAPLSGCAARYASGDAGIDGGTLAFCDDFENKTAAAQGWTDVFNQNGSLALEKSVVYAGKTSLRLTATGGSTNASLATPNLSTVALPFYVELDLFPEQLPTFVSLPYNGFVLGTFNGAAGDTQLVYVGVSGNAEFNPYLVQGDVANLPSGAWYHVIIRFALEGNTLDVIPRSPGPSPIHRVGLAATGPASSIRLGLETGLGPMKIYIDDVFIHR